MSARAISSGTVSFGLVSIPVKLYSTGESKAGISFNMLHDKCRSRLKQQYICPKDNEIVPRDHTVKGYEFSKDQYVVFTEEELEALEEAASKAIEISEFVPASAVDPVYFDTAYYLGPDKGGDRAYRLLVEAMKQTGRCALARYAARGKGYLVLVRPFGKALVMQQLRYPDEVRGVSEIPIEDGEVKEPELKLATQFVGQLSTDAFHPEKYEDKVRKKIEALIESKVQGNNITLLAPEEPKAQIIDLMEALKASLSQKSDSPEPGQAETGERKPPKRSPRSEPEAAQKKKSAK
jgi:DNA end-binding protein Ku